MPVIQIKSGQNLSTIAKQYGTSIPELLKLNPDISNPDFIKSGASLNLPDTPAAPTIDQSARSNGAPSEKSFDGAGSALAPKTLPETTTKSPLLRFSSVLNDALELARQKRARLTESVYRGAVPMGALPANSFADFVSADQNSMRDFTKPLVDTATTAFKADENTLAKNKESIRTIAEKVAENGGGAAAVQKILGMQDVESALIYATPFIKKKTSDGSGEGAKYSPEDLRTLRQAGLASNADPAVKDFFLNTEPAFRADFTKNYAKGVNQNVNIVNIGQSYDDWQAYQESLKKKKNDIASQIDSIDFGN